MSRASAVCSRPGRRDVILGLLLVFTLVAAGCGGDEDEGGVGDGETESPAAGVGVEEAKALVDETSGSVPWTLEAPPIDVGTQVDGIKVVHITNGLNPFVEAVTKGMSDAGALAGVEVTAFNAAGDTNKAARFIEQAIATDADVIVILSFLTDQLLEPIKAATEAGIVVIQQFEKDPGPLTPVQEEAGVFVNVSSCYACAGREMARIAVADSNGQANVVFVNVPDVGVANLETEGFQDEIARLCPDCTVEVADAPIAQWNAQLPSIAAAAAANPEVDYIIPVFDSMSPLMIPSIFAANAEDRIKFISFNADLAQMQQMQDGELPAWAGIVGSHVEWIGWATMDNVFRALLGEPAVFDEGLGDRTFTPENIDEIDLSQDSSAWYGDTDFKGQYTALWGFE